MCNLILARCQASKHTHTQTCTNGRARSRVMSSMPRDNAASPTRCWTKKEKQKQYQRTMHLCATAQTAVSHGFSRRDSLCS